MSTTKITVTYLGSDINMLQRLTRYNLFLLKWHRQFTGYHESRCLCVQYFIALFILLSLLSQKGLILSIGSWCDLGLVTFMVGSVTIQWFSGAKYLFWRSIYWLKHSASSKRHILYSFHYGYAESILSSSHVVIDMHIRLCCYNFKLCTVWYVTD